MRVPQSTPKLFKLISFSVKYPYFKTRQAADSLSVWIRRIVTNAPLEELRLEMLDVPRAGAVHTLNLDGLIYHLSSKHRYTLRILRMGWSFFGLIALADLCKCSNLEELEMLIKDNALVCPLGNGLQQANDYDINVETINPGTTHHFAQTTQACFESQSPQEEHFSS